MDGVIKFCAQYLIAAVAIVLIYTFFKVPKKQRPQLIIGFVLAVILAAVLDKIAGKIYYDPRPFVSHSVKPLIAHTPDNGFPSEHTIAAMTISTLIYFYRKRFAAIAFVLTLVIGVARVAAHVHSPIDIIGGLVIGGAAGWFGAYSAPKVMSVLRGRP